MWHERALLAHPRCRAIYPRDAVTSDNLRAKGLNATYLGNPMMDGLAPTGRPMPGDPDATTVLLLPGSRQEAHANFARLREAARAMRSAQPAPTGARGSGTPAGYSPPPDRPLRFLAAIAPGLPLGPFQGGGFTLGSGGDMLAHPDGTVIHLLSGAFADAAHASDLVLAMAGTATEQVVGLGKPVLSLPGAGPQFTYAFAEAQTRLLGPSVTLLPDDPAALATAAWSLLTDPKRLADIAANGRARMGEPGASSRLAKDIMSHAR
jgi:uncharacterized protein (TIGR03492 family)